VGFNFIAALDWEDLVDHLLLCLSFFAVELLQCLRDGHLSLSRSDVLEEAIIDSRSGPVVQAIEPTSQTVSLAYAFRLTMRRRADPLLQSLSIWKLGRWRDMALERGCCSLHMHLLRMQQVSRRPCFYSWSQSSINVRRLGCVYAIS